MSRQTTALVVRELNAPFKLEKVNLDALQPYEVLVKIQAAGLCHTDISCANGVIPVQLPAVFGHEGAGTVVELGSDVNEVAVGDKVILSYSFCEQCTQCKAGYKQYCENLLALNFGGTRLNAGSALSLEDGSTLYGHFFGQSSFSHLAVVNRKSLVKVQNDIPLDLFAPLGCGLQTGAGAILNTLDVQKGSSVLIFGVGSVGLSAVMAAKIRGAGKIIAVDIQNSRLDLAKELGATKVINSSETNALEEIKKLCPPAGVQYALDCSGVVNVIETMVDCLGLRGKACSVGAPSPGKRASIDVFNQLVMGRQYMGCHQGDSIANEMIPYLIDQQKQGHYPLEKFISYYDVNDFSKALDDIKQGRTIKAVLKFE